MNVEQVEIKKIRQRANYRAEYREGDLSAMMSSMKDVGLLQPIGLMLNGDDYKVIWGNRRFLAAKKLGWNSIPAVIDAVDEKTFIIKNLVENIHRSNPSLSELGLALMDLRKLGLSDSEIAARLSQTPRWVKAVLESIERLPPSIQGKVRPFVQAGARKNGTIGLNQALHLANIRASYSIPKSEFEKLCEYAAQDGVSVLEVSKVAGLVRGDIPVEKAVQYVNRFKRIEVSHIVDRKLITKLEAKTGKKMSRIIADHVQEWLNAQ